MNTRIWSIQIRIRYGTRIWCKAHIYAGKLHQSHIERMLRLLVARPSAITLLLVAVVGRSAYSYLILSGANRSEWRNQEENVVVRVSRVNDVLRHHSIQHTFVGSQMSGGRLLRWMCWGYAMFELQWMRAQCVFCRLFLRDFSKVLDICMISVWNVLGIFFVVSINGCNVCKK